MDVDVIVIGAGAAGMMCAAQAGKRGRRVLLIDHWPTIGDRIRVSGGGRCNFSNRHVAADNYLSHNRHFCRSALARFAPRDFIALAERHAIPYHEREHGQLFCDDSAQDIVDLLRRECDDGGVRWEHPCVVDRIEAVTATAGGSPARFSVATGSGTYRCGSVVIATGGLAVPLLGATPFGYQVASQFGLPIVTPEPALVPLALQPDDLSAMNPLAGVAFNAVTSCAGGPRAGFTEHVLVTHRGLSGPAVLQISSYWQFRTQAGRPRGPITLDLLPGIDAGGWLHQRRESRLTLPNALAETLPRRFAHEWCALHGWQKPLNQLTDGERRTIASAINAWAAAGVPGLFFVGEVVDVTGWLGGYNFQWAWSSGWVAGQYA
ncbi:MAG: aminoacetone oxidase family FAD-binding enzyme [Acidobacteria bacterium]|nr:aminoacetone oxidase family FAD-binding enzyme [Acidobacteriota bacterium]